MGYRITKVYTRTGDDGTTGLTGEARVTKDSDRIEAIGAVDELNCAVGITLAAGLPPDIDRCLTRIQHQLFSLGGELSMPEQTIITAADIDWLERELDKLNAELPPLQDFILPGGSPGAAHCHHARAMCRRAERRLVRLARDESVNRDAVRYLNRLSDLLFVIARSLIRAEGGSERLWQHTKPEEKR